MELNVAKSRLSVGYTKNNQTYLDYWDKNGTFARVNTQLTGKKFVLLDGPPYANGTAHMGHALNKMFKGLVVKSQWLMGNPVHYQPGWDCHGLPLELAVEKRYGKMDVGTLKKRCKSLALRSVVSQRNVFKRLGVLGDWDKPYLTLAMNQNNWATLSSVFSLLDYRQYPVHYCPHCQSSLAEAELETKTLTHESLYFKMSLGGGYSALVWTTTPWTLPMNQALAYRRDFDYEVWSNGTEQLLLQNPEDVKDWLSTHHYHFVSTKKGVDLPTAVSPLTKRAVPLLHADFVEAGKTGFVHVACSHGPEDFDLGVSAGVSAHTYLNSAGVFEVPEGRSYSALNGKKQSQVSDLVLELLGSDMVDYQKHEAEKNVCWRHKSAVYYNATWQVFLELEQPGNNLKERVAKLLADSDLDSVHRTRLSQMLMSRDKWCLSRQRHWGCPLNLLVDKNTRKLSPVSRDYLDLLSKGLPVEHLLGANPHLELVTDVLDVWFDSGNVVNNHEKNGEDYVVDLALEGKDQYRGWFQSMLWLSVAKNNVMPYRQLFCHGFVLDENRHKFAKSSGNASTVVHYADLYGADVLNLWTASQEPGMDAVFSESKLSEMKTYYARMRLCLRFLTSNLYGYTPTEFDAHAPQFDLHRFVLTEMHQLKESMTEHFKRFEFKKPLEMLYQFCDKTLSSFYFDVSKNGFYLRSEPLLRAGAYEVMLGLFDLVKVFAPFAAEEFYQDYFGTEGSVFEHRYYTPEKEVWLRGLRVVAYWDSMNQLRRAVQVALEPLQKAGSVKSRTEVRLMLPNYSEVAHFNRYLPLTDVFGVSEVVAGSELDFYSLKADNTYMKCSRCWNYSKLFTDSVCPTCTLG